MEDLRLKYRPETLSEVWGNEHIKMIWNGYLKKGYFPKSIILYSDYGMGKTTLARIFARDIVQVRSGVDFIEYNSPQCDFSVIHKMINGMSKFERLIMWPQVFIFDEVHNIPDKAQEAFLKPIEDNPFLNFIFATTNLERIDKGLRLRSDKLRLKAPSTEVLIKELSRISELENIRIEKNALECLIALSDCCPRECLGNLQILSLGDRTIDLQIVKELLGT